MVNIYVKKDNEYRELVTHIKDMHDVVMILAVMADKGKLTIDKSDYGMKNGERYIYLYVSREGE